VENGPRRLVLSEPRGFEKLLLVGGAVCLVVGAARLAVPDAFGGPLAAKGFVYDWGFKLLCAAFGCAAVSFRNFRYSWEFDGGARTATRRHGFSSRTWRATDFLGVSVRVGHLAGPDEVLGIVLEGDGWTEGVVTAPSDRRGLSLPQAGERIAELLGLPLVRVGTVVQGGPEVRAALDRIGPSAEGVAALGDGRDIVIHCPACKQQNVPAVSYDHHERQYGVSHTTNWVKCLACGTHLYSKVKPEELIGRAPDELAKVVVFRLSFVARATALLAVVVCLFPWVGTGMALLATLINLRTRGWPKPLSRIALAVSLVPTVAISYMLYTDNPK
jgi:hypothetical protein